MPDYSYSSTVFATTSFVGYHQWLDAPATRFYLRDLHRHVFGVRVELSVDHPDRAIEFHDIKEATDYFIRRLGLNHPFGPNIELRTLSCEAMARMILDSIRGEQWPGLVLYRVTVDEDGENGATVTATT